MATRFYMPSSGSIKTTTNPSFDAGWEQTGQASRLPLLLKPRLTTNTAFVTSSAITIPITTTQEILAYQFVSDEVFYPARMDASITVSLILNTAEVATTSNAFIAYSLRACTADGGTILGTLASKLTSGGTEYATTRATRISGPTNLTATTLSEPFRLILEIGSTAQAPSAAGSYTLRIGTPAATADYAFTSALTTDLRTWMELSTNLEALQINTYQGIKAEGSLSTSGSIFR